MELPVPDYVILNTALEDACQKHNIQNTPFFTEKVQQLYEMINVRHGLMIVGLPFGGKTSAYRMLAEALALVEERVLIRAKKHFNVSSFGSFLGRHGRTQSCLYGYES